MKADRVGWIVLLYCLALYSAGLPGYAKDSVENPDCSPGDEISGEWRVFTIRTEQDTSDPIMSNEVAHDIWRLKRLKDDVEITNLTNSAKGRATVENGKIRTHNEVVHQGWLFSEDMEFAVSGGKLTGEMSAKIENLKNGQPDGTYLTRSRHLLSGNRISGGKPGCGP